MSAISATMIDFLIPVHKIQENFRMSPTDL